MVTHARHRDRRRGIAGRPHAVHQPRARPPGGGVVATAARLRARLAVGSKRGVNQLRVDRADIAVAKPQALAHAQRIVGYEDVSPAHQQVQHLPALGLLEVDAQALLAPVGQPPGIIEVTGGHPGQLSQAAIAVPAAGRFNLDNPGAKIGQNRGGGRAGYKARAVDNQQIAEKRLFRHAEPSPVKSYCGYHPVAENRRDRPSCHAGRHFSAPTGHSSRLRPWGILRPLSRHSTAAAKPLASA